MKLKDILCETGDIIRICGDTDKEVKGLTLDSRSADRSYLFAAIKGENTDGHSYIENAVCNGATTVVCEHLPQNLCKGVTYVLVKDSSLALAKISATFYANPSRRLFLAGVTGTNGKTTLTYILEHMWKRLRKNPGIIGTIENRYAGKSDSSAMTTPDAIELSRLLSNMTQAGTDNVAMEVSSHSIERKRVHGCHFDCAVFTNITQDHLDYHGSFENYFGAKKKFFTEILKSSEKEHKASVVNIDNPYGGLISRESAGETLTYSTKSPGADIYASDIRLLEGSTTARVKTPWGDVELDSTLVGMHNLYNLTAAIGVLIFQTRDKDAVEFSVSGKIVVPGRLERVINNSGLNIFVDYAHTPDALENILKTVRPVTRGRIITVFGCGGDRDRTKRPKMGKIGYELSDVAIITSDNPRTEDPGRIIEDILQGIDSRLAKEYTVIENREMAIKKAVYMATKEDFVLIAGKGHEDYQIIGNKKIHFDDREIARKYIKEREKQEV